MYRSIDLFAGIGGIRKGFENAFGEKIETVFVSEWDENAQKTYRINYKDSFPIAGDITQISEEDVPEFDICLAGFPCQAFSLAGKRMGFEDDYKGFGNIVEHAKNLGVYNINLSGLLINKEIVDLAHENGLKVFVYTINFPLAMRKMIEYNVDGVFTDYPDLMREILME